MLTPKREKFANAVADGLSQADAYRTAFEVKPGTKAETIQANASRLMADSMVAARVAEIRKALADKALWSREDSVRTLADIARGVDSEAKPSDRVAAVKAINAMHGWDAAQKHEHSGPDGGPIPIMPTVIQLIAPVK